MTAEAIRQPDAQAAVHFVMEIAIFIVHGAQKLFGFGLAGVTGLFGQVGITLPGVTGALVSVVEFFGGLALRPGVQTRIAAGVVRAARRALTATG